MPSQLASVTLNFPSEDLKPPVFTQDFYMPPKIISKPSLPHDIVEVSAVDGDTDINADITYEVMYSDPECEKH